MSFNYYDLGNNLTCECDGHNIVVYLNNGTIKKYPTKLGTVIPKDNTLFNTNGPVLFVMSHEGIRYVGRVDGTISGYREKDNLLVRLSKWLPPRPIQTIPVGTYYGVTSRQVVLNWEDKRTCYVEGEKREYVLKEPINGNIQLSESVALAMRGVKGIHIIVEGEELRQDAGDWFVQAWSLFRDIPELL